MATRSHHLAYREKAPSGRIHGHEMIDGHSDLSRWRNCAKNVLTDVWQLAALQMFHNKQHLHSVTAFHLAAFELFKGMCTESFTKAVVH